MNSLLAIIVGLLYAAGTYMMLRRSITKLIIGLIIVSNAANLLIFTVARITRGKAPLVDEGSGVVDGDFADPLPQALILTAIVISFGVQAFAIVLIKKVFQVVGTDDLDNLNTTDKIE
jgi:multicomponent Na+:H+ antiporter subunit C